MTRASDDCTVLLSAAGRRPYLVHWFREALAMNGVSGRIVVADANPLSPARSAADVFVLAPLISDPGYEQWLRDTVDSLGVRVAFSLNDFELSTWAALDAPPPALVALDPASQLLVEDKLAFARAVQVPGIGIPTTWLASEILAAEDFQSSSAEAFVVKSRYGSGSVGLRITDRKGLAHAVTEASREVLDVKGRRVVGDRRALEHVIVQERIAGVEFGVDVVSDFERRYAGCFARTKLSMRHGETDEAVTVDPSSFAAGAASLTAITRHRGLMDTDVIVDTDDRPWLIDVNPRFGGGYPFSHIAGAHAPAAIVAWALGREAEPGWLSPRPGIVSAKSVQIVEVGDPLAQPDAPAPRARSLS